MWDTIHLAIDKMAAREGFRADLDPVCPEWLADSRGPRLSAVDRDRDTITIEAAVPVPGLPNSYRDFHISVAVTHRVDYPMSNITGIAVSDIETAAKRAVAIARRYAEYAAAMLCGRVNPYDVLHPSTSDPFSLFRD